MNICIYIICHNNGWMVRDTLNNLHGRFPLARFVIVDQASNALRTRLALKQLGKLPRTSVKRLPLNVGPRRIKRFLHQYARIHKQPYILTDPDLALSGLPADALDVLSSICRELGVTSAGLALDLSEPGDLLEGKYMADMNIRAWESQFWKYPVEYPGRKIYLANIDTTFCYYDWSQSNRATVRLAGNYCVRHLPWHKSYIDHLLERDYWDYFLPASKVSTSSRLVRDYWMKSRKSAPVMCQELPEPAGQVRVI